MRAYLAQLIGVILLGILGGGGIVGGQNLLQANIPGNVPGTNNNNNQRNRQSGGLGGLSFEFPGLSLLRPGGANGGQGGGAGLFGVVTTTRTVVATG